MGMFRQPLTVHRHNEGKYVDGVWEEGGTKPITVRVSVQPTSPEGMQELPSGRRESKSYTLYGDDELRSVQVHSNPDTVEIGGETYEVATSSEWRNGLISYNRSIVTRVSSSEN